LNVATRELSNCKQKIELGNTSHDTGWSYQEIQELPFEVVYDLPGSHNQVIYVSKETKEEHTHRGGRQG